MGIDSVLKTFADIAFSLASILTQGIVLLIDAMIPIMTYNDFVNNPVVTAGWAIVRDTVNMFFVIVLIAIAFGTIFGASKFKWQQQITKLLIFAIVINFSKTLCGIMIDFGQVIMLTFANALREIAAGNFIQLLGLNQLYSLSATSPMVSQVGTESASGASDAIDFLAAGVMSVLLTLWVLGTLVIFVVILLYRIVMLWVLIVVAPLTWFVGGTGDLLKSDAYKEWWSKFTCLVGVGPVVTFFLWLTLAVAGAGSIAANSGFDVRAGSNNAGFASELLQLDNFLSFLIGMMLLMAGLDAAQKFCSSETGMGKLLGAAKSGALQKTVAGLGLKAGSLGLKGGSKVAHVMPGALKAGVKYIPGSAAASRLAQKVAVRQRMYAMLGKAGGNTAVGRFFAKKEGEAKDRAGIARTAQVKKEEEKLAGKSPETIAKLGEKFAQGGAWSAAGEAEGMAILSRAMTDKKVMKDMRASGALQELWKRYGAKFEQDNRHDASKVETIKGFKKTNADFTGATNLISDWDDVVGLDDDALKDKGVRERLKDIKSGKFVWEEKNVVGEDGNIRREQVQRELSAHEAITAGDARAGALKQKALTTGKGERFERMTDSTLAQVDVETLGKEATPEGLQRAVEAATRMGDNGRAKDLIAQLAQKLQSAKDEDKGKLKEAMDGLGDSLLAIAGGAGVSKYLVNMRASLEKQAQKKVQKQGSGEEKEGSIGFRKMKDSETVDDYIRDFDKATLETDDKTTNKKKEKGTVEALNNQDREIQEKIQMIQQNAGQRKEGKKKGLEKEIQALKEELDMASRIARTVGDEDEDETVIDLKSQIHLKEEERKSPTAESAEEIEVIAALEEMRERIKEAKDMIKNPSSGTGGGTGGGSPTAPAPTAPAPTAPAPTAPAPVVPNGGEAQATENRASEIAQKEEEEKEKAEKKKKEEQKKNAQFY